MLSFLHDNAQGERVAPIDAGALKSKTALLELIYVELEHFQDAIVCRQAFLSTAQRHERHRAC